ncbi:MAG: gamma carbonic anhydrase family protein [Mariprofundus sp.]|nr:gamma carbonic anhydrase family protein [Mariprofundus sp.]
MIKPYLQWEPEIAASVFVADSADLIGRVKIGNDASIWYQTVLRGDVGDIIIGERSNIQDHSMLHTSTGMSSCIIGDDVTIGHRVTLHGCEIQHGCLVGMGSIIMDQAVLEAGCLLAAGSLVTERKVLRGGYLYAGSPATERRELTRDEKLFLQQSALHYVEVARNHRHES